MGRRIGLLGGTFDPPHYGHLWLAETARQQLQLDEVLFLPVGTPVHKAKHQVSDVVHRKRMVKLALADEPHFSLDTSDVERPRPHAMYSLLTLMHQAIPAARFWLLLGTDSLRDLSDWIRPEAVVAQCRLAALERAGVTINWPVLQAAIPDIRQAVDLLSGPTLNISSTEIRLWASKGYSLRYLLPSAVASYVSRHALYRAEKAPNPS
jgi:nicotinate-nucleotide adenylyltransferase